MKYFTCYYFERSIENTRTAIVGPTIHNSFEAALEIPFKYAKNRIIECDLESEFTADFEIKDGKIEEFFKFSDPSTKEDITNWYFNFMNDESCDAKYYIEEHDQTEETTKWEDDTVQFSRLICEINANVEINEKDHKSLCESMDLDIEKIHEIFERADTFWEATKLNL
jgi:hypothetical protein